LKSRNEVTDQTPAAYIPALELLITLAAHSDAVNDIILPTPAFSFSTVRRSVITMPLVRGFVLLINVKHAGRVFAVGLRRSSSESVVSCDGGVALW
jgi:hypothetical protein